MVLLVLQVLATQTALKDTFGGSFASFTLFLHLWHKQLKLTDIHWINGQPDPNKQYQIRTRYRADLIKCTLQVASNASKKDQTTLQVALSDEVRAITPGQSAVIYDGEQCLGGGIII